MRENVQQVKKEGKGVVRRKEEEKTKGGKEREEERRKEGRKELRANILVAVRAMKGNQGGQEHRRNAWGKGFIRLGGKRRFLLNCVKESQNKGRKLSKIL